MVKKKVENRGTQADRGRNRKREVGSVRKGVKDREKATDAAEGGKERKQRGDEKLDCPVCPKLIIFHVAAISNSYRSWSH